MLVKSVRTSDDHRLKVMTVFCPADGIISSYLIPSTSSSSSSSSSNDDDDDNNNNNNEMRDNPNWGYMCMHKIYIKFDSKASISVEFSSIALY